MATIRRMIAKHYDRRTIARHIDDVETILMQIDASNGLCGKAEVWGIHSDARTSSPTTYGFRVRWLPRHRGRPVVMAIVSGRRRPGYGSRRKPV